MGGQEPRRTAMEPPPEGYQWCKHCDGTGIGPSFPLVPEYECPWCDGRGYIRTNPLASPTVGIGATVLGTALLGPVGAVVGGTAWALAAVLSRMLLNNLDQQESNETEQDEDE